MWEWIDRIRAVLNIAEELEQTQEEIKDIRLELRALTRAVVQLQADIRADKAHAETRRENLILHLQREIDRLERRLPPPHD